MHFALVIEIYTMELFNWGGIFIRRHLVLNKCGLWCSLISACSTCSVWALSLAGSLPRRLLKEPLHLCQGQVEICRTLLIGQSAFQTPSHHTQIRLSYRPGVNRGFHLLLKLTFLPLVVFRLPCRLVAWGIRSLVLHINYKKSNLKLVLHALEPNSDKMHQSNLQVIKRIMANLIPKHFLYSLKRGHL